MLLILTIVFAIAAVCFALLTWRLRAGERRRSDARVAALSAAIDAEEPPLHDRRIAAAPAVNSLFEPEHSAAATGAPVVKLAVGIAMSVALLIVIAMSNRGGGSAESAPEAPAQKRTVATRGAAPLELISMRHERDGDTLKVSGFVRNPRNGAAMTRVTAVVFAFNRAGAFVTSGRAGLDFTTLEPGDESPFVVTIPSVPDVARYRVSFRTEAGVVQHVDRRAEQMRVAAVLE